MAKRKKGKYLHRLLTTPGRSGMRCRNPTIDRYGNLARYLIEDEDGEYCLPDEIDQSIQRKIFDQRGFKEKRGFSDCIGHMRRMVHSWVGRPWDDYRSYITECFRRDGASEMHQWHYWEHVSFLVDWNNEYKVEQYAWPKYYVDDEGILREKLRVSYRRPVYINKNVLYGDDSKIIFRRKKDGLVFELTWGYRSSSSYVPTMSVFFERIWRHNQSRHWVFDEIQHLDCFRAYKKAKSEGRLKVYIRSLSNREIAQYL
jgi:hypothetical protein